MDEFEDDDFDDAKEMEFDNWDGDICPHCGSVMTFRIDTISSDPVIWHSECAACGKGFEVLIDPNTKEG